MKRKSILILLSLLVILVFAVELLIPRTRAIDLSGEGTRYLTSDPTYEEPVDVTFSGNIRSAKVGKTEFRGTVDVPSLGDFGETARTVVNISGDPYTIHNVEAFRASGELFTPPILTILMPEDGSYAVIVPFTEYEETDGHVTATFTASKAVLICAGDISRDEAVGMIRGYMAAGVS